MNDVEDQSRTPSLLLLLRAALQRRDRETHTGMPCEVQSYDPVKQLVDVQPLILFLVPDEGGALVAEQLPVLSSIPVQFAGGGGMRETFPLALGDTGWVKFSEASLDAWQAKGGLTNPGDQRRFSIADAVFEPGLHANDKPWKHANAQDYSVGADDGAQVVITPTGIELGGNSDARPTDPIALAPAVKNELTAIRNALDALTIAFNAHVHAGVTAGVASTSPIVTQLPEPAQVGDVASSNVKSK